MARRIFLFLTAFLFTFGGSFHFGYQLSCINPTKEVFNKFFNNSFQSHHGIYLEESHFRILWSIFVGLTVLGAMFGAPLMPFLANRFGRKTSFYLSSSILLLAVLPCAMSKYGNAFELIALGRFFVGIGTGLATALEGVFLTEISPKEYRGIVGSMSGFMIQFGVMIGSIVGTPYLLGNHRWPAMFWIEMVPIVLLLLFLTCSRESPNFLVAKGLHEKAENSLWLYQGADCQTKEVLGSLCDNAFEHPENRGFANLFKTKLARKGLILGVLANLGVAFSGITATSFFATHLLAEAGLSYERAALANVGIASSSAIGCFFSVWTVDKYGRRPLLLFSCGALFLINSTMMGLLILYDIYGTSSFGFLLVVVSCLLMLTFGMGLSPIALFVVTELVPENNKASAQAFVITMQYLAGFISPVLFFPLQGWVGPYSFLLFIVPQAFITVYFFFFMPETKNSNRRDIFLQLYGKRNYSRLIAKDQVSFDEQEPLCF